MQAPAFWRYDSSLSKLLTPAAYLYDAVGRWRRAAVTPVHVKAPVICVGNLVAGGAGKTPTALAIAALLQAHGRAPHFLTRGYGGRLTGPIRVEPALHTAADVGDEPLLLARQAPTWVSPDRPAGARAAIAAGADVIVMDDGLQNPYLAKDLSLIVVDDGFGFGNGRVHPAGPLREDLDRGLMRADAVVLVQGDDRSKALLPPWPAVLPVLTARLVPTPEAMRLGGRRGIAFAGIGRPERFFASVRALGIELVASHAFADHHAYAGDEIMALVEAAHAADAVLVTTAKDAVRLPDEARRMVEVIDVNLEFEAPDEMLALLGRLARPESSRRSADG